MLKYILILVCLIASSISFSATDKSKSNLPWKNYGSFFSNSLPEQTIAIQIQASETKVEKKSFRSTASINESSLSPEFVTYRNKITKLGKNQTSELNQILEDLNTNYASLKSNDTKLLAAYLSPLKSMRGLLWNVGKIAEGQMGQSEIYVTLIRGMYSNLSESQNNQAELILNYIAQPFDGMTIFNSNKRPSTSADPSGNGASNNKNVTPPTIQLQNTIARDIYPAIVTMANRIANLDLTTTPVPIDLKSIIPNLPSGYPRFTVFGQKEKLAVLATSEFMLARISILLAYDYTNYPQYLESAMMGMNQMFSSPVGLLPEKSIGKIKEYGVYNLTPSGKQWLSRSLDHYKKSYDYGASTSSIYMSEYKDLFDSLSRATQINISSEVQASREDSAAMLKGKTKIVNKSNGRILEVDMPSFFANPPDAYSLLPVDGGFASGPKYKSVTANGHSLSVFNPEYGRPIKWNLNAFQKYFPGSTEEDIPFIKSTLSSFGIPFAGSLN